MNEHLPAFQSRNEPCLKGILFEAVLTGWSKHRLFRRARFSAIDPPARFDQGTTYRQWVPVRRSLFRTVARVDPAVS